MTDDMTTNMTDDLTTDMTVDMVDHLTDDHLVTSQNKIFLVHPNFPSNSSSVNTSALELVLFFC